MRFDKRIRFVASLFCVFGIMMWLPVVIYVPALAFNQVTGINIHVITPIVTTVCIFYTCVGGIKAVVWTDVIQSMVMFGSVILIIVKGTIDVGGIGLVFTKNFDSGRIEAPTFTMDHTVRFSIWSVFIGSTFHWLQNICADQILMQRFLSLPNLKAARRALVIFIIGIIVLYSSLIYTGMILYAKYHSCDPLKTKLAKANDQLVPLLVMDILGHFPGLPGLFIAAVFSAALSSLSTGLNSLSAIVLEDFVKMFKKKKLTKFQTNLVMRSTVIICGIICMNLAFVVEKLGMVLQLSASIGGVSNGPILGIFLIGMLMPWINGKYLELRFDKKIRLYGSVLFTISVIIWLPIVIFVPALAFNQVTGVNIHIITPIVCIVCIFYTTVGGLKAVVWTDVIQTFVMFGSIIIVILKGTYGVGGFSEVFKRNFESGRIEAPEITFDPSVRLSIWSVLVGSTLFWTQSIGCNQVIMQRFLALPNIKAAKKSLYIFIIGLVFLYICTFYNGMLIFAKYHKCDPLTTKLAKAKDQLVPLLVMDVLSEFPGLPGLFVAGVFSAALSSLSTGLNSLSAIFLEDFLKPNINFQLTERQTGLFLRFCVVLFGTISILLVFVVEQLGMVLQLSITLSSVSNGPLFGIFLMGLLMPWINSKSALTGGLVSFIFMAYVCIKAQIDIATGILVFPTKPTSIEECHYAFDMNHTMKLIPSSNLEISSENLDANPAFHHMSFLWYIGLGAFIAIAVGNISILLFGRTDPDEYDPRLMSPFLKRFFKCKKCLNNLDESKEAETVLMSDVCNKNSDHPA